jgi:ABC-2 type transport system permease protein
VHAEWTKLRTVPSTPWLVLAAVAFTVAASAALTASVDTSLCPSPLECHEDTTKLSLGGVQLGQVAVVVLAVLAITGEYGTGTIQTTLAARPHRAAVLLTKAAVVTATVLAAAGRARLPGRRARHPARQRVHRGQRVPAPVAR